MKTLVFDAASRIIDGRHVRAARFVDRSHLPVSAVCLVANAVRESLAALYAREVDVRVFAPVMPSPPAWRAIAADATLYRVRGDRGDAAIVVRAGDALAIAAAAFGETVETLRPLSPLERQVLDRTVAAIAHAASPVCGALAAPPRPEHEPILTGYSTFFEIQVEQPVRARIGMALAREPLPPAVPSLRIDDLLDLQVELAVRVAAPPLTAGAVAALELGAIVPMTVTTTLAGAVVLAGREIARGECGVVGSRFALAIAPSPEGSTNTAS